MKKILCFILSLLISLSAVLPVMADDGDVVAKLIVSVKNKFNIDDEAFTIMDYSKSSYKGNTVYYLSWEAKSDDEYDYHPYINVRVRENGDVESYNITRKYYSQIVLPKYSESEAIVKATELVAKIAPDKVSHICTGEIGEYSLYTVNFKRIENNIPAPDNFIAVELDPQTLELISYRSEWTDTEFISPEGIIPIDSAIESYKEKLGYEPTYNIITENKAIKEIYISYEPKHSNAYIDAFSGEAKQWQYVIYESALQSMNDSASKGEGAADALSPEELKLIEEIEEMITKEDAEKLVRNIEELSILKDASATNYNVSKNSYGTYIATITFSKESKDDYYYAYITLNAATKEILSFRESVKHDENAEKIAPQKAEKTASDFLNKYYGEKLSQTKVPFTLGEDDKYNFTYNRYANGIRVKNNGLSISVDPVTGNISSFNCNWADAEFTATDNIIPLNMVYKLLLSDNNFELRYIITRIYGYDEKTSESTESSETYLAYTPVETPIYDAITGNRIDSRGKPIAEKYNGYNDIEGHYCEKSATELAKIGICFEGASLKPDSPVSQEEFLRLALKAVNGYDFIDSEQIYRNLLNNGFIDKEEIGKTLTRMDGIKYFINIMGFKAAASINGIYKCTFSDVADDMQGYAAIAGGLRIINTSAPTLRANDVMTRAECLTIIYNYLSNR